MGRLESPYPRRMALMALYPQIKKMPQLQITTYCLARAKDCSGVFKSSRIGVTNSSMAAVSASAAKANTLRVVPMVFFTSSFAFIPVYFPTRMVLPRVSPVIMLVMICVTWVPVDTAATLSGGQ